MESNSKDRFEDKEFEYKKMMEEIELLKAKISEYEDNNNEE